MVPFAVAAAYGAVALAGTKTGLALALVAAAGPVAVYLALVAPLIFPFCVYIVALPFDNLLEVSSFGTLTKILGIVCGAAIAFQMVRYRRSVLPDRAFAAWLLFVAFAAASSAWAINPSDTVSPLITLVSLFLLYAALAFAPIDRKTLRIIVQVTVASGTIAAAYGAYLFARGIDVGDSGRLLIASSATAARIGTHIDPNHFAASLLLPIALTLVMIVESRRASTQLLATLCLLIMGAGVTFSGSRGAIVAIAAMLLYFLIRSKRGLLAVGVAIAGLGMTFVLDRSLLQRFSQAAATGGAGRLQIWKVGFMAFMSHPLIGVGFGNFPDAYNQSYVTAGLTQNMYWSQEPHNNLLWAAVELGVIGLLLFLYASWTQFRSLSFVARNDALYPLRTALEASMIALFVASLFLGTLTYKYFWLALILMALTRSSAVFEAPKRTSPIVRVATRPLVRRRFAEP